MVVNYVARIIKNYQKWMCLKTRINNSAPIRSIKEGDIWWVAVGENVGVEIDGKNEKYSRPVIVLKKHGRLCFTGVPLTSQCHDGSWYISFEFQNKIQTAILIQTRLFDTRRLYERIGRMSRNDLKIVLDSYIRLLEE